MGKDLFEKEKISTAYLKLAIPVVLSMVIQLVYNMVDTYFIALTGNTELIAGVSICTPLFLLFLAFGDMFALGGSSVISRLLGAGREEDVRRLSAFCMYGSVAFGIITTIIMMWGEVPVLEFLGADDSTMYYAMQYYEYIVLGSTFIIFILSPINLLRTVGQPNASMAVTVLGAVVNMVLDPVFIFALGMGAAGAAIATIIGYGCAILYSLFYINKNCKALSIDPHDLGICAKELQMIFAVGLPASVTNFMQTIGMTLTNRSLVEYGSDSIAVMGIVLKIVNIVMLILVGLAFGGQPLTGYSYGAGNRQRLRQVLSYAYKIVGGVAAVMAAGVAVFAHPLINLFLQDESLIAQGIEMLYWQLPGMILMGWGLVTICTFQSMGKGMPALILSMCRQGVVYGIVITALSMYFGYTGVIASQLVADILSIVIAGILFWQVIQPEL
ncbi:Multi antimicrobial extrusion protein (Na(+)/drug antiporter) [Anaerovibrio sp. JC8]|uniref:MATE family efflux transporter n=1 Tax=Anaerovibrio sp. JC8 TaxID=1240085 RepID=UPI000A0E0FAD|nr:MATE family efflux transporter [Anaerovibrio sp. JC8]ORT98856.1 Multi antimicrobial extrusion protein (Na(+)/drug antiporter) [Anaerovibrio sp. JC8]